MTREIERIAATILSSGSASSQQRRAKTPTQALIEPKREDFKHLFPLVAKDPTLVKLCVFVFGRFIVLLNIADFRK